MTNYEQRRKYETYTNWCIYYETYASETLIRGGGSLRQLFLMREFFKQNRF